MPIDRLKARAGPRPVGSDQIRLFLCVSLCQPTLAALSCRGRAANCAVAAAAQEARQRGQVPR